MAADVVALARASLTGDNAALAALASKVLGYAVVAGASVLKVPQIAAVLRARSAKGLSRTMFEAEIVGYTVVLAYSLHRGLSFNAFGEVVFMLLQNAVLLLLIYRFSPPPPRRTAALWGAYVAAVAAYLGGAPCFPLPRAPFLHRGLLPRPLTNVLPTCSLAQGPSPARTWSGRMTQAT